MNKHFIFSIFFLGLMLGQVQAMESKNNLSQKKCDAVGTFLNNGVVVGWLLKSVWKREICGNRSTVAATILGMSLLESESPEVRVLGTMVATVNVAKMSYDVLKRSNRVKNAESQTEAVIVAGPWHSQDHRDYELSRLPMFAPQTRAQ